MANKRMNDGSQPESTDNPHIPRQRRRHLLWKIGLVVVVGAVLFGEISSRLLLGLGHPVLYQKDAACGYLPVPNQSVRRFFCVNKINSQSMRSPEILEPKPTGEFRLMLVGDSVTYGTTHVDQSKIFASLLRSDLPRIMGRPVEVLNASTGAWAPGNEWGYLHSRGTFDSDEVAFVLNTGDLDQPFDPGGLGPATGYPDHDPPFALEELFQRYILPRVFHRAPPVDAGASVENTFDETAARGVLKNLTDAAAFAHLHHAGFAIIYCGWPGPQWSTPAYRAAFERLKTWAAEYGVPVIDTTLYLDAKPVGEVFQDGMHLRVAGNEIMAHAIEDNWRELLTGAQAKVDSGEPRRRGSGAESLPQ